MTPEQQRRVKSLFFDVRTIATIDRAAFLDRECADDAEVRAEVESLLRHSDDPTPPLLQTPPPEKPTVPPAPTHAGGTQIGHYRLIKIIGRGGMGVVYLAEQDNPQRQVALKLLGADSASEASLKRFEHEAQVLGRLQHPGIAQIFEAGTFDLGNGPQPYFAMEYIDGLPLTAYAQAQLLGNRQRLELMAKVCEAVHHAHQKGVIHRDLKPGNILVDESGQPKVLDFGIARVTDADLRRTTLRTDVGQLMGTVAYMSPEQAAADPHDLDTRSDVYALGVICYELLTDQLPHDLKHKALHEATRVIREDDPRSLSSFSRALRGDIETIVGKALEKDRQRRYQSALDLAEDVRRYLRDEPVTARPPSFGYQASKFARRHKALVGGTAAVMLVLIAGLVTTVYWLKQAIAARNAEAEQKAVAEQRADQLANVVGFQSRMLSGFDQELMGLQWRDDVLTEARSAMMRSGLESSAADSRIRELQSLLAGTDFTTPAVNSLDRNVIEKALADIDSQFADQPLVQASLLQTVAITLSGIGRFQAALDPQTRTLEIRRLQLGDDAADTLISENEMGLLLSNLGRLPESEQHLRRALAIGQFQPGESSLNSITVMHNLGTTLQIQGRYEEAEKILSQALASSRSVHGDDHPDTLSAMQSMGELLVSMGKFEDARTLLEASLAGRKKILGEDDPETLTSMQDLGVALRSLGKQAEALPYLRQSLEGRRRVLGGDHRQTLMALINISTILQELGRVNDALPYSSEALESYKRIYGPTYIDTLGAMLTHGVLLWSAGRNDEGLPYIRQALEGGRKQLDQNPNVAVMAAINLCSGLTAQNHHEEALPYCQEAVELCLKILPADHAYTLIAKGNLAQSLSGLGRHDEAVAMAGQSTAALIKQLSPDHPQAITAQSVLGTVLRGAGRFAEAEGPSVDAAIRALNTLGPMHPTTRTCAQNAIALYEQWNTAEPGKGHDQQAGQWRGRITPAAPTTSPMKSSE